VQNRTWIFRRKETSFCEEGAHYIRRRYAGVSTDRSRLFACAEDTLDAGIDAGGRMLLRSESVKCSRDRVVPEDWFQHCKDDTTVLL